MKERFGGLDVLINNAGNARKPKEDLSDFRQCWMDMYNTNVIGVGMTIELFLPLAPREEGTGDQRLICSW